MSGKDEISCMGLGTFGETVGLELDGESLC